MGTFANHPSVQHIRTFVETARAQAQGYSGPRGAADNQHNDNTDTSNNDDADSFSPPVDIFDTQNNWTIHVSVPGAKRDDIGVTWDADKSILSISGVVYRPGDEEFLGSLLSGERKVGLFERKIQLPPPAAAGANSASGGEKEEVDGDHITAKMEDGILILVVPKAEKEWTEVKRVDIE
ncbi:HSP20-like chaperone [Podospora didyma]|uniref:HSP20-like chaperone n=1 Tax=Podospora didyma TaxID=330526 RepID=A0AAE0P873_9PEZI|nr:HSP20-like chaperone [Podospora didyma]